MVDDVILHGDPRQTLERFDPNHPSVQILLLSQAVETLRREKEALEDKARDQELRLKKIERSFNMGAGIMIVVPILGTAFGMILAFGNKIFKPWTG